MCDVINHSIFYKNVAVNLNGIANTATKKSKRRKVKREGLQNDQQKGESKRKNKPNTLRSIKSFFRKRKTIPNYYDNPTRHLLKVLEDLISKSDLKLLNWNERDIWDIINHFEININDIDELFNFRSTFLEKVKPFLTFYNELKIGQPGLLRICGGELKYLFWTQLGQPKSVDDWLNSTDKETVQTTVHSIDKVFKEKNMCNDESFEQSFYDEIPGEENLNETTTLSVSDVINRSEAFNESFSTNNQMKVVNEETLKDSENNLLNISSNSSFGGEFNRTEIMGQSSPLKTNHIEIKKDDQVSKLTLVLDDENLLAESSSDPFNDTDLGTYNSNNQNKGSNIVRVLQLNNSLEKNSSTDPNNSSLDLDISDCSIYDEFLNFSE